MVKAQPKQPRRRGKALKEQKRRLGAGKRQEKNKRRGKKRKEDKKARRDRRRRTPSVGDGDALDCCVLLTRLEEKRLLGKLKNAKGGKLRGTKDRRKNQSSTIKRRKPSVTNQQAAEPKPRQSEAVLTLAPTIQEHRRRRMASLNAEAVNSVLLYRDDYPASNLAKKQRHISQGLANSGLNKAVYTEEHTGEDTRDLIKGSQPNLSGRPRKRKEAASVDWSALLTPTPKRQAGLTAATLLKLASLPYGKRRPRKTGSESQTSASQREATREQTAGEPAQTQKTTHPKREEQLGHGKQDVRDSVRSQLSSKKETFDRQDRWRGTSGLQECYNCGYQCRPLVGGFSLKSPKEEQETSLSPCYCCSHEMCVEYSHRLALFLKEKNFKESEDGSLSKVFHHHHHHHHHHHQHHLQSPHAIHSPSMSDAHYPHGYTCCPGYYVHFSHPDTPPSPIPPVSLCSSRGKSISGISHPLYCCTSMGSCYGEACRVNRYCAYNSGVPGVGRRACSFCDNDCTKCNHSIKNENFSPALNDHHSPSVPISPSPRTLTGCPVPTVPPAGQSVPHIQTPLSDPRRPQPLQVAKECPQNAKAPSGSKSGAGSTGNVQSAVRHFIRDEKKKPASGNTRENTLDKTLLDKKNGRRKATNGWQPVGVPYQKKVFTVGEEEPVQRKCFEGVHRDGEVIRVRDTVLLRSGPRKKSLPYVAKISALWEDPESGEAMMSLFWYYRPEHTQGGHNPSMHCENEIFASRHQDVNSVACIEDKCYVLTLAQYCRFCALVKYHKEGIPNNTTSIVIPPTFTHTMPAHLRVPDDVDPLLVFVCRHVYDFRYGRLLKNLQ